MLEIKDHPLKIIINSFTTKFFADVGLYSAANVIVLLSGIIQSFILLKYLPIEVYGYWRLFMLYAGYVGFLHLGFVDGVFLAWLGKSRERITGEFKNALKYLGIQQISVIGFSFILLILISTRFRFNGSILFIMFSVLIYALVYNYFTLIIYYFQVIKLFQVLSLITTAQTITFLIGILLLYALRVITYKNLVYWQLLNILLMLVWSLIILKRIKGQKINLSLTGILKYGSSNIQLGWYILIGNIVNVFGTDLLIISAIFSVKEFAYYSMASSAISIIYITIRTISSVFLPYLASTSQERAKNFYPLCCSIVILIWGFGLGLFFPLSLFIQWCLPKYIPSLPLIKILIGSVGYGSVIMIVHNNYYKLHKLVKPYLFYATIAILLFILLNLIGLHYFHSLYLVAYVTLISFAFWYLINEYRLSVYSGNKGGVHFLIITMLIFIFWLSSLLPTVVIPMFVYYILLCICYIKYFHKNIIALKIVLVKSS